MKTINLLQKLFIAVILVGFASCSDDDEDTVACTEIAFYADTDSDGLGDPNNSQMACENDSIVGFVTNSDDDDDTVNSNATLALVTATVEDLFAPATGGGQGAPDEGPFIKFDFATGAVTDSETEWDIAFRSTAIAINGGVSTGTDGEPERTANAEIAIALGLYDDITTTEGQDYFIDFSQDTADGYALPKSSDMGWYNYNFMTNVVSPVPGRVILVKTRDGRYAKLEIISYYEGAPANPDGFTDAPRYYTFNYTYNPNENDTSLE